MSNECEIEEYNRINLECITKEILRKQNLVEMLRAQSLVIELVMKENGSSLLGTNTVIQANYCGKESQHIAQLKKLTNEVVLKQTKQLKQTPENHL